MYSEDTVTVERTGDLHGITIDMSSSPDTVQTLCMVAAMATTSDNDHRDQSFKVQGERSYHQYC